MRPSWRGYAYAATGVLVFSFTLPMVKLALHSFNPWTITFVRMAIAGATALIVVTLRKVTWPDKALWHTIFITGFGISFGFPVLSTLALQRTTSAHGAVIIAGLPLATAALAVWRHHERPRPVFWVGATVGVAALSLYAWHHGGSAGGDFFADLLLVGAVLASAMGYSEGAHLTRVMPGWQVVSWCVIFYLPISAPAAIATYYGSRAGYTIEPTALAGLLFISFGSMYLGFFAWYRGLAELGVAHGGQVQLAQPLLTIAWSAMLLGEHISTDALVTAAVVLACVVVTQRGRQPQVAPSTAHR